MEDQAYTYTATKPRFGRSTKLIAGVAILILVLLLGIVILDKNNYKKKGPTQKLREYAGRVLKPGLSVRVGSVSRVTDSKKKTVTYRAFGSVQKKRFSIQVTDNQGRSQLEENMYTVYPEETDGSLPAVIRLYNQYFKMPNVPESSWKKKDIKGGVTFEVVTDNLDASFDTRSAYVLRLVSKPGKYTVKIATCHVTNKSFLYARHTCLEK